MEKKMDILVLLKQDHQKVDDLFQTMKALGEKAYKSKSRVFNKFIQNFLFMLK